MEQNKLFFKEHEENLNGYHIVVVFNRTARCGYIGLPKGHKLEERDYSDFDFDVHGGLTFGSSAFTFKEDTHDYYFGFDCMHCDDGADIKTMIENGANQHELFIASIFQGEVRTKEYVLNELKSLVTQIENYKGETHE